MQGPAPRQPYPLRSTKSHNRGVMFHEHRLLDLPGFPAAGAVLIRRELRPVASLEAGSRGAPCRHGPARLAHRFSELWTRTRLVSRPTTAVRLRVLTVSATRMVAFCAPVLGTLCLGHG